MKLVYVFLGGSTKGSSVQQKVNCQVEELNNSGIQAEGWFFSTEIIKETELTKTAKLIPLQKHECHKKYFKNFYINQNYYKQIKDYLEAHKEDFDFIFIRHGSSGTEYFKLLQRFKNNLALFIPSNSIRENFCEKKQAPYTSIGSFAFRWWEYFRFFYLYEKKLIKSILPKLKAVVTFTEEFGRILNNQAGNKINIIYNRDGADCKNVPVRELKNKDNKKIKLLFMKGSSMQQPWAGLERLMQSIEDNGANKYELYITGNVVVSDKYNKSYVKLTGRLSEEDLNDLVNEVDLGVSNLANYMIHFNETTNLKSRGYYARGLPFIQANTMPDIEGTIGAKFYLNLPNTSELINMKSIEDFAIEMRNNPTHHLDMRAFADEHLDWKVTAAELAKSLKAL